MAKRLSHESARTWASLRRAYAKAEQCATNGFKSTAIFEPWGGAFPSTRAAVARHGWTCSQPLDKPDGYDLLTYHGVEVLWCILEEHGPFMTAVASDCKIWSAMTNFNPEVNWERLRRTVRVRVPRLVVELCMHRYDVDISSSSSPPVQLRGCSTRS